MKERRKILLPSIKVALKIYAVVLTICIVIFGMQAVITNKNHITNWLASKNLKLTYEEVGENDNNTQNSYVKFDAYFLEKSGSTTKKLRGKASDLNDRQELQLELNVLTNGHLENGKILLNSGNYKVAREIVTDNVIKNVYSNYTDIRLNDVQNGTYKTIPVLIEQDAVSESKGNKNKLSNINSVTFTGTHVAEDGTRTKIEKTVNFKVDWYGTKRLEEIRLAKTAYVANQKDDKVIIGLQAKMWSQNYNDTYIQVPDKAAILNSTIPMLNGYAPEEVTVADGSSPSRELTYTYNKNTRKLEVRSEVKYDKNGIGEKIIYGSAYLINITIKYPYVAYQTLGANTKSLSITASGYLEGHNNPNEGFTNPVKSLTGSKTININLRNPQGDMIIYDAEIDLLTKSKLRLKYDRNIETDNGYRVTWNAKVNYIGNIEKLIYEEDVNNTSDSMQQINGRYYDLEGLVRYSGVKIPETSMEMLEDNGYVKVINAETGETIKLITKNDADKYIKYDNEVEHIKIETSKLKQAGEFKIYNYKKIDNEKFVNKYTKSQFNEMSLVHTALNGKVITTTDERFINRDVGTVEYEDGTNLIYVVPTVQLNTQRLNEKTISIDLKQYSYTEDKNLTEWVDPSIILEYPQEIEEIRINKIYSSDGELKLKQVTQEVINGKKIIRIKMEGVTKSGSSVKVEQNIKMNPKTNLATGQLRTFAYNELCDQWHYIYNNTQEVADIYDINKDGNKTELRNISVTELIYSRPTGLNTTTEALNFDSKGSTVMGPDIAEVEKQEIGREATIRLNVYNNYNTPVTKAKIVGKIPFKGNTYQINGANIGSTFTTQMKENGIILPNSLQGKAKVYYSEKETVNENITDSANEWTSTPRDWSKVKTYLIDLSAIEMASGDMYTIDYKINFPETLTYGTVSYATHAIYFEEQTSSGKVPRSTETNKVGFSISTPREYDLQIRKLQQYTDKTVQGVRYKITGAGINENGITYTTDAEGKITISNLFPEETYTLEEIYAPSDYVKSEEKIQIQTYIENGELKARIIQGKIKGNAVIENATSDTATIKIDIENEAKYNLRITKYKKNTDKTIERVRFNIKGKGLLEEGKIVETDSQGITDIEGLQAEEVYTLQEIYAPNDYVINEEPVQFKVTEENGTLTAEILQGRVKQTPTVNNETRTLELAIENEAKYNIEITKYETGTTKTIPNVRFQVKGKNLSEEGTTYTTDEDGKAVIRRLELEEIYTIRETYAKGYYVDETEFTVKVTEEDGRLKLEYGGRVTKEEPRMIEKVEENSIVEIKHENVNIPKYNLELTKVGEKNGNLLEGAKFEIEGAGREKINEKQYVTAQNGTLTIENLYENEEYTIKEILAPKGYKLSEQPVKFKATQENGNWSVEVLEGNFKQTPIVESNKIKVQWEDELLFKLQKVDEETGEPLQGAKYVIQEIDEDKNVIGYAKDVSGQEIGKLETIEGTELRVLTTDEQGIIIAEIAPGLYQATEVQSPFGYSLPEERTQYFGIDVSKAETAIQSTWGMSVGQREVSAIKSVLKTNDGGYLIAEEFSNNITLENGETLTSSGEKDVMLVKYDSNSQIEWAKSFGGEKNETINSINLTNDGGYILGGQYGSPNIILDSKHTLTNKTNNDSMIIKYTREGNVEWARTLEDGCSWNISVIQTKDGGYIEVGGLTRSVTLDNGETLSCRGNCDALMIKYTAEGKTEWGISVDGRNDGMWMGDVFDGAIQTSDGEYIAYGEFANGTIYLSNGQQLKVSENTSWTYCVIKFSKDGKVQWANDASRYYTVKRIPTNDGGYVEVGGFESSSITLSNGQTIINNGEEDGIIIKYTAEGKIEWATSVGGVGDDQINEVVQTTDGGYMIGGRFEEEVTLGNGQILTSNGATDGMLIKYTKDGQIEWGKAIGGRNSDTIDSAIQSKDGGYVVAGETYSDSITLNNEEVLTNKGKSDIMVIKYSRDGQIEWGKTIGGDGNDYCGSILEIDNRGYIVEAGSESSSITLDNGQEITNNNSEGVDKKIFVKLEEIVVGQAIPETQELIFKNRKKEIENPAKVIVHHYIDGTTTKVPLPDGTEATDEEIPGQLGMEYETNPKIDLDKYELVQDKIPENARGTMDNEVTEVTYYYKLKDAKVIVHHYIEDTTTPVPLPDGTSIPDDEITGKIDDPYETEHKKDLEGYEVVTEKLPENKEGTMTKDPIEVIYYYKLKQVKITTEVEGVGGTISGQNENPYEEVKYNQDSIKDIKIVPDKNYRVSRITINGEEIEYEENMDRTVELPLFKEMKEDKHIVVSFEKIPAGKVIVKYLEYGTEKELADQEEQTGNVGDPYETRRKEIEGYKTYGTDPINASGDLKEEEQQVIYYYTRVTGTVIVKYIDIDTGEEIERQEMISGNAGDEYSTKSLIKDIEKYKLVEEDVKNETGTYIDGIIEVVYKYQKIPARVIVKYLEEGTNKELAKEEEVVGVENDPYDVTELEKEIKGYDRTKDIPANKEGEMTKEDITVIYYYTRKQAQITDEITKNGTDKILLPTNSPRAEYEIEYNAQIQDYMGNAKITITDKLPYAIDEENSNLADGIYDNENKTITWNETIENIDTYENGNKQITITKNIEVVYKNVDYSKESIINKAVGKIELDTTKQSKETDEVEKETVFEKPEIELETNITKTGDEKVTDENTNIYYEIKYTGEINNFIGKAKIKIVDQLPYEIDEEKSSLDGGKYNKEDKTITWEETIEEIDTYKAMDAKIINRTKSISLKYIYTNETLSSNIDNTVKVTTDLVEKKEEDPDEPTEEQIVKTEEKQDDHKVEVEIPSRVIVHHYIYDSEKQEYTSTKVAEDEVKEGNIGDSYTTKKSEKVPENYEVLDETPDKHEGKITKDIIEVIYYYQLKQEMITNEVTKTAKADKTINLNSTAKTQSTNQTNKQIQGTTNVLENDMQKAFNALSGSLRKDMQEFLVKNNSDINTQETNQETSSNEDTQTTPQTIEVLTQDGGKIDYTINSKVTIKDYIGKAKITIKDMLPAKINVSKSDLANGHYYAQTNTITWNETVEDIDTFAKGTYEKNITKKISVVYEGQNKVSDLKNTATSSITTYYPENHTTKPNEEKQTITKQDEETVKQEYKTNKTVEKVWNDNDDKKGNRPNSIKIQLTANGQEDINGAKLEETILSEENAWTHTFADLPKYDSLGNKIEYSVKESEVNKNDLEYYEEAQISNLDKIIVTNNYKLTNTEIERTIEKEGTEEITKKDQEVNYHIKYSAVIKDYIGEATVTIVDLLPCKIDETKSNLQGGEYNEDTQTITWKQELGHINTTQNETEKQEGKKITIEKDIKVVYKNLDTTLEKITNIVRGKIEFTQNDSKNEVENSHDTIINVKGKVIVKYVEKDSKKEIATREEKEDKVGKEYSTEQKTIYGYTYVENSGNTVGTIKEGTTEVIYYYEKTDAGKVTVKYVDEEGNEIAKKEIEEGKIGDPYETKQKEIENYELEKVTGDETKGTLGENEKEVIYHYKKIKAKVIVRYLEKGSNKELLAEEEKQGYVGEKYETERKPIKDYRKAEPEPLNKEGKMTKETIYVTYYYEKIPSGKITVKYVDIDTKEEITYKEKDETKTYGYEQSGYVGEKYKTQEKQIPYYEYLSYLEPTNKEGNYKQEDDTIIYYYRKLPFNIKVDKKVKEASIDNQKAKIEKDGKIIKMDIIASKANKAKVEIRYEITVTNTGKIEGKTKVTDKIPEGFEISKQNASYWNKTANNTIETQVELKPGESKKLEVILIWKNQNDNFGTKINNVMITDIENPANYEETDKKDNVSVATVVISVKTGAQEKILATAISAIISSGLLVLLYQYERYQKERNREIRHLVLEGKNVVIKKKKQK